MNPLLLDTCAALWLFEGSDRLPETVRQAARRPEADLLFHQASYWEITLKYAKGSLGLKEPPSRLIPKALAAYRIRWIRIENADIAALEKLPRIHGDPFDRLLVTAAHRLGAILVTPDPEIHRYPVRILW